MSMNVQGIGVACGVGCTLDDLHAAVASPYRPDKPLRVDMTQLNRFVPPRALRRMDHFSKLALLGAHLALENAQIQNAPLERTGIIIATGNGPTETTFQLLEGLIEDGASLVSPLAFTASVHNIPAATVGIQLKISGPCSTISQFRSSVVCGLQTATLWLDENRVDRILFGCVDEYSKILHNCMEQAGEAPPAQGEGAIFFLLDRDEDGVRHGRIESARTIRADELRALTKDRTVSSDLPIELKNIKTACHVHAWGDMPTAQAFDLAYALTQPETDSHVCLSLEPNGRSHCILSQKSRVH